MCAHVVPQQTARLLYSDDVPVVADLFNTADDDFFHRVKTNFDHVLQPYLPDPINIPYQLRNRSHNITLINKTKFLNDTDFIIRMLYKYSYWHTIYNPSMCMIISLLLRPAECCGTVIILCACVRYLRDV